MATAAPLKAPFPYPGGKSRVVGLVWDRLGNPDNYVGLFVMDGAVAVVRVPPGFLGGALGTPPPRLALCDEVINHAIFVLGHVLREVIGLRQHLKVGDVVVEFVFVLVVNNHARRDVAVVLFPDDLRPEFPDVRLGDLDPSPPFAASLVAGADGYRADRKCVV